MRTHAALLAAITLVLALATVPSAAQQVPMLTAENLPTTTVMVPNGPPSQAIMRSCNGGFEFGEDCWLGWLDPGWGPQSRASFFPYQGTWHLPGLD